MVNGGTVARVEVDEVTYWHVELDSHDVILAENLACESYLEMGNRAFFADADVVALDASPDAVPRTHADYCRPFHLDGPVVASVRDRLAARAAALGWRLETDRFAGLHLEVDGVRVEPRTRDLSALFVMPAEASDVWLVSDTSVPAEIGTADDRRPLGVCVGRLVVDDGFGTPHEVLPDDPRLGAGFHEVEPGPMRWTAGRVPLPASLWETCDGSYNLRVDLAMPGLPRWAAPAEKNVWQSLVSLVS